MKTLLSSIVLLLGLILSPTAYAQSLTLDQLTYLNGLEQMSQDAYLTERGWKFDQVFNKNDSVTFVYWRYYDKKNVAVGEVAVQRELGERDALIYTISTRAPFEALRNKVLDYHMELLGNDNSDGVMRTYFRGKRYDVMLSLFTEGGAPFYRIRVQPHGLVKGFSIGDDGKMTEQWVRMPIPTAEQKARWDVMADSLEKVNQLKQQAPVKKARK